MLQLDIDTAPLQSMAKSYAGAQPIITDELVKGLTRLAIVGQTTGRKEAPVDTGRLRSSIAYEIIRGSGLVTARVGTNVQYGKAVEYGTGLLSEAPDSGGGRHWPPAAALDGWAMRHGFAVGNSDGTTTAVGSIVAEIIGKRGGLRPRPYLRPALKVMTAKSSAIMERAVMSAMMRIARGAR